MRPSGSLEEGAPRWRQKLKKPCALPYVDETVADWGGRAPLPRSGWVCVGGRAQPAGRARALRSPGQIKDDELFLFGRRRRGARHVPSSTSAATAAPPRRRARGPDPRFQCPYHAWIYDLDGTLKRAPHTEQIDDFDPRDHGLVRSRSRLAGLPVRQPRPAGAAADTWTTCRQQSRTTDRRRCAARGDRVRRRAPTGR